MVACDKMLRAGDLELRFHTPSILCGCAEYWAKPGATPTQFEAAKAGCQSRGYQQFPPMPQLVVTPSAQGASFSNTKCSSSDSSSSCTSFGGYVAVPAVRTVDANAAARDSAVRSCLFQDGWIPAKDKEEADAIFRSAPQSGQPPR
jgi:hypothetical protein